MFNFLVISVLLGGSDCKTNPMRNAALATPVWDGVKMAEECQRCYGHPPQANLAARWSYAMAQTSERVSLSECFHYGKYWSTPLCAGSRRCSLRLLSRLLSNLKHDCKYLDAWVVANGLADLGYPVAGRVAARTLRVIWSTIHQ